MKNFRSYNLAVQFYRSAKRLPITGPLREQLERASSSIALNLAEGEGRGRSKDQIRFYKIAFGSLRECQAILDLAVGQNHPTFQEADSLAAHLYRLIQATTIPGGG